MPIPACASAPTFVMGKPPKYGTPDPRYIRPLVRINAQVQDIPQGYVIPACYLDIAGIAAAIAALP